MPKETKKFINPLLRPSQDVAAKPDPVARPTRKVVIEEEPEEVFLPPAAEPEVLQEKPVENLPQYEEVADFPIIKGDISLKESRKGDYTSTSSLPYNNGNISKNDASTRPGNDIIHREDKEIYVTHNVSRSSGVNREEVPTAQPEPPLVLTDRVVAPYPQQPEAAGVAILHTSGIVDDRKLVDGYYLEEEPQVVDEPQVSRSKADVFSDIPPAHTIIRRRRGEQTFEKTHERITLWVDKRLKQAFEELAYDGGLSKTALLNEAIADLLRKYHDQ